MALTKVKLIADGTIVQSNLHASHGITTADIGENASYLYYTDARARAAISVSGNALSYDSSTGVITSNFEESPTFTGNVVIDGTLGVGARTTITDSAGYLFDVQTTDTNQPRFQVYVDDTTGVHLISGYNTTAKSMLFNTGGSERMRINSSGNIGIGTTSPTYKLHVAGTTAITGNLTMSTSAEIRSSDGTGIRLRNAANSANEGGFVRSGLWEGDSSRDPSLFAETGLGLRFYTGGSATERMTINSSGDVDIANTIYTGESLRFNGTGLNATDKKLYSPTDGELQWFTHNLAGAKAFSVSHQGTRQVYLNVSGNSYLNGGNVGIGTTSPSAKLDVQSSGAWGQYGRGSSGDITVENTNTSVTEGGWIGIAGYMGNTANGGYYHMAGITAKKSTTAGDGNYGGDLSFWTTAGSGQSGEANSGMYQRMTINRFGNVGIGNTNPLSKLHITNGDSGASSAWTNADDLIIENSGNAGLVFQTPNTGAATIAFQDPESVQAGFIQYLHADNLMRFATNGNNIRAVIDSSGYVGIGLTNPGVKLEIQDSTHTTMKIRSGNNDNILFAQAIQSNDARIGTDTNTDLSLYTNGGERMRITSGGDINCNGRIKVSGGNTDQYYFEGARSGVGVTYRLYDNSNNVYHDSWTSQIIRINQNGGSGGYFGVFGGNVGIGETSPDAKLHVVSTTTPQFKVEYDNSRYVEIHHSAIFNVSGAGQSNNFYIGTRGNSGNNSIVFYTGGTTGTDAGTERVRITQAGEVGIGTTSPSYKLSVNGSFYSNSVTTNTYSDANSPPAAYVGRGPAAYNSGGMFRLGQVVSSSSANATNVTVVTTYSSGHWGSQPTFFLEFSVSYYRPSYIKYYCQHEVSGTRMNIIEGPYGGQISSTPLSVTVTQLCASCHGGQPVYKAVWKWSNNGTYLRTSPFITMFGNPASLVYTDGSSSESALDTLFGSSSTPGHGYLLHSINNTQAAGHPRLSTQT